jgi:hypothetical protein
MQVLVDDPATAKPSLGLFGGYGIELEYMIVDRATLGARPISDLILVDDKGSIANEIEKDGTCWSNELVMHVIEIKSRGPSPSLLPLVRLFERDIVRINQALGARHAMLMPTAMHPFFVPEKETKLWSHEHNEIYDKYNQIFDCRGHGWSNLQSMHINLPFADNEEFGRLHAAIRLVLPLLPAIAASSPVFEGKHRGILDHRLEFYRNNQKKIPQITGDVVPEQAFSIGEYHEKILNPLYKAIKPFDPTGILQEEWLNSRGAIARFDRNAIEIRLLDIQECPRMDLAIASAVVSLVKSLVDSRWISLGQQKMWSQIPLQEIFKKVLVEGDEAVIDHIPYLKIFDPGAHTPVKASKLWKHIIHSLNSWGQYPLADFSKELQFILNHGCLARRILEALQKESGKTPKKGTVSFQVNHLQKVYTKLSKCLTKGVWFDPNRNDEN